ncbi:cytidylate kinase family protein [Candidatus Woesearchaeota archaeon]|nr:cytidylate kinase family protein [Candidatus Woesearchaeota archaeon]
MIITISGTLGSGKSTVAKILCKEFNLKYYYTGSKFRQLAEERGLDIHEFAKIAEKDRSIDIELDNWQKNLGKTEDNFLLDGHIAFHFVPSSIKIFLDGKIEERARRIFTDKVRKETNLTFEDTLENIKKREASERKRFMEYYGIDHHDKKNFDLVVDTTDIPAKEVAKRVIEFINKGKTL